jgi:hypothetical protein
MPGLGQERGDLANGVDAEALAAELDRIRPAGEQPGSNSPGKRF